MKLVLVYDSARAICSSVFIFLTTTNVPMELQQARGRKENTDLIKGPIGLTEPSTQHQPGTHQPQWGALGRVFHLQPENGQRKTTTANYTLQLFSMKNKTPRCFYCRFTVTPPLPAGVNAPDLKNTPPACIFYLITMIFRNMLCCAQSTVINLQ